MPRIRGRFAPLFEELGNDHRWLIGLNDDGKLLYFLILLTIYTNNNEAPDDLDYYIIRYNLRCSNGRLRNVYHRSKKALSAVYEQVKSLFPKLVSKNKKLSLLNYRGYDFRVATVAPEEVEVEEEVDKEERDPSALIKKIIQPKPKSPKLVDLRDIQIWDLSEGAKHKIYNGVMNVFKVRGWILEPEFLKPFFADCIKKLNGSSRPKDPYPYVYQAFKRYVNENADSINAQAKIYHEKNKREGVSSGSSY